MSKQPIEGAHFSDTLHRVAVCPVHGDPADCRTVASVIDGGATRHCTVSVPVPGSMPRPVDPLTGEHTEPTELCARPLHVVTRLVRTWQRYGDIELVAEWHGTHIPTEVGGRTMCADCGCTLSDSDFGGARGIACVGKPRPTAATNQHDSGARS